MLTIPGTHDREEKALDTQDPGGQIADVESQVEALRCQLQDTDERFRAATGQMLSEWYWKEAERSATHENPERALGIGADGINALQEELHKATAELLDEIGKRLSLARPSEIGRELREMTGPLGRILESHGIISPGGPGYEGLWAYLGRATSGSPTYDGELLWTDEMSAAKEEYLSLEGQLTNATEELAMLRHQKAQEDAKRLWDEARDNTTTPDPAAIEERQQKAWE